MRLAEVATDFKGLRKCIHAEAIIAIAAGGHAGVPPASVRRHGDDRVLRPGGRHARHPDTLDCVWPGHAELADQPDTRPPAAGRVRLWLRPVHHLGPPVYLAHII